MAYEQKKILEKYEPGQIASTMIFVAERATDPTHSGAPCEKDIEAARKYHEILGYWIDEMEKEMRSNLEQ